jgi:hypothetical protein
VLAASIRIHGRDMAITRGIELIDPLSPIRFPIKIWELFAILHKSILDL